MQTQLKNLTEQFEEVVGTVRSRIVDTNEYVADTVSPYIDNISDSVNKTADNVGDQFSKTIEKIDLPKIDFRNIDVPFADKLPARSDLPSINFPEVPAASKIVDSTFNAVSDAVEANRKFVTELVGAWSPAPAERPAKKPAAKKPAAKKSTAKKSTAKASAKK